MRKGRVGAGSPNQRGGQQGARACMGRESGGQGWGCCPACNPPSLLLLSYSLTGCVTLVGPPSTQDPALPPLLLSQAASHLLDPPPRKTLLSLSKLLGMQSLHGHESTAAETSGKFIRALRDGGERWVDREGWEQDRQPTSREWYNVVRYYFAGLPFIFAGRAAVYWVAIAPGHPEILPSPLSSQAGQASPFAGRAAFWSPLSTTSPPTSPL